MRSRLGLICCGLVGTAILVTSSASMLDAQEKGGAAAVACNVVHVPVIKKIDLTYDGTKSITVSVAGEVPTSGYTNTVLIRRIYVTPPADGIWEYDMLTCKPGGITNPVLSPVMAKDKWESPPRSLKGIRVYGSQEHKEVPVEWPSK